MRKYRAEQIMKWYDIRDGWKMVKWQRKMLKEFMRGDFIKRKEDGIIDKFNTR